MYDSELYRSLKLKVCIKSPVTHNTQTHKSKSNCCSHGEIRRTGGPTGQKLIRSDKSCLFPDRKTDNGRQIFS